MAQAVTLMMASRGCSIFGSGTSRSGCRPCRATSTLSSVSPFFAAVLSCKSSTRGAGIGSSSSDAMGACADAAEQSKAPGAWIAKLRVRGLGQLRRARFS